MSDIMTEMVERLARNRDASESKSYFIGLERGRIWASDDADYFEMREWSELEAENFDDLELPPREELHFKVLGAETELEWNAYLKGWLDGVREIVETY
ncbi:hypothetical protein KKB44_05230 [Candidatus Micrarchaeota archaeon]|nr:hypothetical protein [Candidatus Micrarchaeota archaeon]